MSSIQGRFFMSGCLVMPDRFQSMTGRSAALRVLIGSAVIVCGLSVPPGVVFAKAPLGKQWPATQQVSLNDIDHSSFDDLLARYVDIDGNVDYSGWKASKADREKLTTYLQNLSRGSTTKPASHDAKLAFWINAYNAVTIEGILQEYPTTSIRNHTAKVFGYNIWQQLPLIVSNHQYSLEQIEHKILRKMNEPRIHFAIVCASVGCPRLRNEAYTASRINIQLADNSHDFFSRRKNLQIDANRRTLMLSSILSWFDEDFGRTQAEQLQAIKPYLPRDALTLISSGSVSVSYLEYDWSLNDQSRQ